MKDVAVLAAAIVAGFVMLSYDQRTDDTGVEAALLVAISLALALAAPHRFLGVGLGVGLPIAVFGGAFVAVVLTLIGAGLGRLIRLGWGPAR